MGEIKESAHTKWRCEYHIVFAPKYRRKEIYGKLKADIGQNTAKAMRREESGNIRSTSVFGSYSHSVPPHLSIAQFMGYSRERAVDQTCQT